MEGEPSAANRLWGSGVFRSFLAQRHFGNRQHTSSRVMDSFAGAMDSAIHRQQTNVNALASSGPGPGATKGKRKAAGPQHAFVSVESGWILRGGATKEPQILTDVEQDGEKSFVKLTHQAIWMCRFVADVPPARRPLANSTCIETLRAKYRENALKDVVKQTAEVAGLGLDDGPPARGPRSQSRKAITEESRAYGVAKTVTMPTTPGAETTTSLNIIVKPSGLKDVYLEATKENLAWLHDYLRAEIAAVPSSASASGAQGVGDEVCESPRREAYWCRAASSWRVRFRTASGDYNTVQFYVAREPKDSFAERSESQHQAAVEHYRANNV